MQLGASKTSNAWEFDVEINPSLSIALTDLTSNHPIALSFEKDGQLTYVAHNYSENPINVTFSDGFQLYVEPRSMGTNRGSDITGIISSEFYQAYVTSIN